MPDTLTSRSYPIGATVYPHGVNFCVFSKNCTALELRLFDEVDVTRPSRVIRLDPQRGDQLHIILNAYWEPLTFELPPLLVDQRWHRLIDTARPPPDDFTPPDHARPLEGFRCRAESRSVVVLNAQPFNP